MNKSDRLKKGFTLTELVIVMAVSAIVIAMIFPLIIMINNHTIDAQKTLKTTEELEIVNNCLTDWYNSDFYYEDNEKSYPTFSNNKLTINDKEYEFSYIEDIKISTNNSTVKAIISVSGDNEYVFLYTKR